MGLFKRIDSFDVTFADSFAHPDLKVNEIRVHTDGRTAKKGVGEKRIYCGHAEEELNKFLGFSDIPYFESNKEGVYNDTYFKNEAKILSEDPNFPTFFIEKEDLEEYYSHVLQEYTHPTYNYGKGVKETLKIYQDYEDKLNSLEESRLYFRFLPKFDDQNRYYLKLPYGEKADSDSYSYIHEICLPRVSRLLFVKLIDIETKKPFIYVKPFYGNKVEGAIAAESVTQKQLKDEKGPKQRKGQDKYRASIFDYYPYCVVTKVTDPNLLIACHIKDYAHCNQDEQYDKYNGFTMTPTIHTLFDLGYLSFDANGTMLLSDFFRNMDRRCLGLMRKVRVDLRPESIKYLEWHNAHTFIRTSRGVQIMNEE